MRHKLLSEQRYSEQAEGVPINDVVTHVGKMATEFAMARRWDNEILCLKLDDGEFAPISIGDYFGGSSSLSYGSGNWLGEGVSVSFSASPALARSAAKLTATGGAHRYERGRGRGESRTKPAKFSHGPFAPVVGYAGAIMAAGAALFLLWGGKMQKWRPPDEDLPGTAQAVVLLLCGVGMVLQWYFAVPDAIAWFLGSVAVLAVGSVLCFLQYSGLLGMYIFIKRVATDGESTSDVRDSRRAIAPS